MAGSADIVWRFFGGKGGVGKTTCAAASAVAAAARGARVLVVSTDPAHSLGDALDAKLGAAPRKVWRGLHAAELDADRALARWLKQRRRLLATIAERGTYLKRDEVDHFLDLSFPGVDELVGLLELARLADGEWDEVVVDTAPTGHTLRLLEMPATLRRIATVFDDMQEKHRVMASALAGRWRQDAADQLVEEIDHDGRELTARLRDPDRTDFRWVLLPEELPIAESRHALAALEAMGVPVKEVIVNRVTPPPPGGKCVLCEPRRIAEGKALTEIERAFGPRPIRTVAATETEPIGVRALLDMNESNKRAPLPPPNGRGPGGGRRKRDAHRVSGTLPRSRSARLGKTVSRGFAPGPPPARERAGRRWEWEALASPKTQLLLFAGKGGVGKTTCAATAALLLAARDPERRILVLSTDPAHSLGDAFDVAVGDEPIAIPGAPSNLRARELDAAAAFARTRTGYQEAVDELFDALRGGSRFDPAYDRAVVRDLIDLAPPGLDELFAILSVVDALFPESGRTRWDLVVVDTAPTGHALRMLEMPATAQEWVKSFLKILYDYREVIRPGRAAEELVAVSRGLRRLREALADPARARVVAVSRAAALPVVETGRLLARLRANHLALAGVIANAVTSTEHERRAGPSGADGLCARCRRNAGVEERWIAKLAALCPKKRGCAMFVAPAIAPPPRGVEALARWGATWNTT